MHNYIMGVIAGPRGSSLRFPQTSQYILFGGSEQGWIASTSKLVGSGSSAYRNRIVKSMTPDGPWYVMQETFTSSPNYQPVGFPNEFLSIGPDFVSLDTSGAGPYKLRTVDRSGSSPLVETPTDIPGGSTPICFGFRSGVYYAICAVDKVYTSSDGVTWTLQGTLSGVFPAPIGANSTIGEVRPKMYRVGTRWFMVFNQRLFCNDTTDLLTGWNESPSSPIAGDAVEPLLLVNAGVWYLATRTNGGHPNIWSSADAGLTWAVDPYNFPTNTGFENPASYSGSAESYIIGMFATGPNPYNKLMVYTTRGVLHQRALGGSTWQTQNARAINPSLLFSYDGRAMLRDAAAHFSAGQPSWTGQIRYEVNGLFEASDLDAAT